MSENGTSTTRSALLGALILFAFVGLVAFAVRGAPDAPAPSPVVEPTVDAPPAPRSPRVRTPQEPASKEPLPRAVRVAVTSMDGTPIAGARVELFRGPEEEERDQETANAFQPSAAPPESCKSAASSDAGAAVFDDVPDGRWFVVAKAPGFARHAVVGLTREDGSGDVASSVALAPGRPFVGTVRGADGAPCAGVAVILAPTAASTWWPSDAACLRTASGADGAFRFDCVEAGEYDLWFAPQTDLVVRAERLRVPAIDSFDVRYVYGGIVEGALRDADGGAPVAHVSVVARGVRGEHDERPMTLARAVTDEQGRFRLQTWRGRCLIDAVYVDDPRWAPCPAEGGLADRRDLAEGQRVVVDLRATLAASLTGVLRGPSGPIAGLGVVVETTSAPAGTRLAWRQTVTDADGRYRVAGLPAGRARVSVCAAATFGVAFSQAHPEMDQETVQTERSVLAGVTLVAGRDVVQDLTLERKHLHITGRVVDDAGAPIAGASIRKEQGSLTVATVSAADGTFAVDADLVGAGTEFVVRKDGFVMEGRGVSDGIQDLGDVPLSRLRPATGRVIDSAGRPVPGARVGLRLSPSSPDLSWSDLRETTTDADGSFHAPIGPYGEVRAWSPNDGATSAFGGAADATTLPTAPRVTGRVVDDVGAPLAGVFVHGGAFPGAPVIGRTDADGRFAADFLPTSDANGEDALWFERDRRLDVVVQHGDIHGDRRVEMAAAFAIRGVVRGSDGSPVGGVTVYAMRVLGDEQESTDDHGSTSDSAGRFVVEGLVEGRYGLHVLGADRSRFEEVETTVAAGRDDVVFILRPAKPR